MPKIYKITSRGKTWEQVADNASQVKKLIAARFGMHKMPKGTVVEKIGLTKEKTVAVPLHRPSHNVESKKERFQKREKRKELKGKVLTGPSGESYTIGQKGRVPLWVKEQLEPDTEEFREEPKTNSITNWMIAQKTFFLSNASFAEEIDGKVVCGYVGEDCETEITEGTKYAILIDWS
jgi:hypothetical protein